MLRPEEIVAVVVVSFNSQALLPDLLASLPEGLQGLRWQLIVVDNASIDCSVAAVRRCAPEALIVETGRNGGYAAGINAGVAAAPPHTAVLVLNPDVRLTPGCVGALIGAQRRSGSGIAVPHLVDKRGLLIESMRREPTILRMLGDAFLGARRAGRHPVLGEIVTDPDLYSMEQTIDWAEGSTLLISADCWDCSGPWDESYFLYSEETDFALRARDAGFTTLYVPSAHAIHLEGESAGSPALWSLLVRNRIRLYRRRHGLASTTLYWAALLLREASRALLGRATSAAGFQALVSPRRMRERPGPDAVHIGWS